jgi:hypothetical protein
VLNRSNKKSKKSYANKQNNQKSKIRRLWSKRVFLVILVKTFLGNQKKDIYKCPKSVFPKRSWEKQKCVVFKYKFSKGLKGFEENSR